MAGTRMRVRIDRKVWFNGTIKDWANNPPDVFKDMIRPDVKPEPHFKAILVTMADAVFTEHSIDIDVTITATGWTMKVSDK